MSQERVEAGSLARETIMLVVLGVFGVAEGPESQVDESAGGGGDHDQTELVMA